MRDRATILVDASDSPDVGAQVLDSGLVDGPAPDAPISALSCEELEGAWHDFSARRSMCSTDRDCVAFETHADDESPCDCPDGLQATLSTARLDEARQYADRYDAVCRGHDGVWTDFDCDGSPLLDSGCVNGFCGSRTESCLAEIPEGGDDPGPVDGGGEAGPVDSGP